MAQTAERVQLDLTFLVKQELARPLSGAATAAGEACLAGSTWTALCLELDIASCGPTEDEAVESLRGLVELYVGDCVSQGEYPIPLRPVPCEALQEFLSPPRQTPELSFTARRASFPVHGPA